MIDLSTAPAPGYTVEMTVKKCSHCGEVKSLEGFYKKSSSKDGKSTRCKSCERTIDAARYGREKSKRAERSANYYQNNKDHLKAKTKAWYQGNKEKASEYHRKYRINNKAKKAASDRAYYLSNKDKASKDRARRYRENGEAERAQMALYRSENVDKIRALKASYKASKRQARPNWLTQAQKSKIEYFYHLARDCTLVTGEPYQVDHIIPLNGDEICGLHVPWNLQVLPADINLSKSNGWKSEDG